MNFVHKYNLTEDTIAAIATPIGDGAIAIIRISGKNTLSIVNKIFSKDIFKIKSHTATYGKIIDEKKQTIDYVLLLLMKGPKSYTGEDSVEIQCHGGRFITKAVLEVVLQAGARAAEPGEFTLRAFKNNKMDLTQAEAVQSLIQAKSLQSYKSAKELLDGTLSKKIISFQKNLIDIAAILEAWVDFPEEDLEFESFESVIFRIEKQLTEINSLIQTFDDGKKIHEGLTISLIGAPNVGKSSLMNLLLKKERAIVSKIAGTTRDTIEEECFINDYRFRLIDTAGIRETNEEIEREGIKRSLDAIKKADIIFYLLDASKEILDDELEYIHSLDLNKTIIIQNKCDLKTPSKLEFPQVVNISILKELQINELLNMLANKINSLYVDTSDIVLTHYRHKKALVNTTEYLNNVIRGLKNKISAEFVCFDMRCALRELASIIGTDITNDILSAIFSKFCLGK
jgi:tRNA modification GTPase